MSTILFGKKHPKAVAEAQRPKPASPIRLVLPYPPSLNRMYRAVNGRSILSREGRAYKTRIQSLGLAMRVRSIHEDDVHVVLRVFRPAKRGDLDNTLKATLDALSGVAYRDDKQVRHINVTRFDDKLNPRVEVFVYAPAPAEGGTPK